MEKGCRSYETEVLDKATRYNECVMTSLRTSRGVSLQHIEQTFGTEFEQYCLDMAAPHLKSGKLDIHNDCLSLTRNGIFISDDILSDLMYVDE